MDDNYSVKNEITLKRKLACNKTNDFKITSNEILIKNIKIDPIQSFNQPILNECDKETKSFIKEAMQLERSNKFNTFLHNKFFLKSRNSSTDSSADEVVSSSDQTNEEKSKFQLKYLIKKLILFNPNKARLFLEINDQICRTPIRVDNK